MNDSSGSPAIEEMLRSASTQVSEKDIDAAQESAEKMKQHSDSLDMLQHRMFALDSASK